MEIKQREEELSKKPYTYLSNGDIAMIKPIKIEYLPKNSNYEIKTNLKKAPISEKGIYAYSKP